MTDNDTLDIAVPDELATLKARADMMGVPYHPSIGLDKLREKVAAAIAGDSKPEGTVPAAVEAESEGQRRVRLRREANELVRIRVTCMNPFKKEWEGEIIATGNSLVGTFSKYVPFNNEEGWYVPRIILKQLEERQCQIFYTVNNPKGGKTRKGKLIKEFAIEKLPNLTTGELQDLAQRQAMNKSGD